MMSEWYNTNSPTSSPLGEPIFPQQYMRRTSGSSSTAASAGQTSLQNLTNSQQILPATTTVSTPNTSFNSTPLTTPVTNCNLDNASAKKRWLRQAISEETEPGPGNYPSPNSRPNSPLQTDCIAPLKKRRLARASMSSEISNTPPSTPNNADEHVSEHEQDVENDLDVSAIPVDEDVEAVKSMSVSEVSSAEEDDDLDEPIQIEDEIQNINTSSRVGLVVEDVDHQKVNLETTERQSSPTPALIELVIQPQPISTPRRSRWDQIESKETVSSPGSSPVKGTTLSEPIVLDYVRDRNLCLRLNFDNDGGEPVSVRRKSLDKSPEHPFTSSSDIDLSETIKPIPELLSPSPTLQSDHVVISPVGDCPVKECGNSKEDIISTSLQQGTMGTNITTPTKRKVGLLFLRNNRIFSEFF